MAGLELALDLSRSAYNSLSGRGLMNANKQPVVFSKNNNGHEIFGLHYVPGEYGGYQTVLKKESHHISSLAMLAFSSSESERSHSTSSETSGFHSMTSNSPIETTSMKLKFNGVKLEPVMYGSRNILDLNGNVRGNNMPFYTPATSDQSHSIDIKSRLNFFTSCPDCGFQTLD